MIQVYNGFNTDFNKNGRILNNVSSCYIIEELNGAYYLELEHYKDKQEKYKELKGWNIIKADGQLFRIPNIENIQEDNIKIKVTAYHIFYDLLNDFIEDRRIENSTVENALRTAIEINPKFIVGECDIESINTAYFIKENPVKVIFDKILPRWGGELYRNNYEVAIRKNIGKDTGILIKYGKNIKGFKEHIDYTGVATRILPIGKNGLTIELVNGGDKYLYSPRRQGYLFPIQSYQEYPFEATREVKFEEIEDATELKNEAMKLWGIIDVPKVTYEINLIDLSKTIEYKEFKYLYSLRVGDIVKIRHEIFNVDLEAKVIKTKKNVLTGILEEIVLGDYRDNFAKTINNIAKSLNETQTYVEKIDEELQDTKTIVFQNQEQISLQAQRIENIETNTNELEQRISEAELKITPESIVSTVRSSTSYNNDLQGIKQSTIEQLSDEINLKVDKDGIISAINMSPEGIKIETNKLSIIPSNGNNLILGSNFLDLKNFPTYEHAIPSVNRTISIRNDGWTGYENALQIWMERTNFSYFEYGVGQEVALKPYTTYTLSGYIAGHRSEKIVFVQSLPSGNLLTLQQFSDIFGRENLSDWQYFKLTFTTGAETRHFIKICIKDGNWSDSFLWLKKLKLEEGEFATPWCLNENEIITNNVIIDSSGITIKSNNGETVLTSEGINASKITTGYISADKIKGNTLTLGGSNNTNGTFVLKNSSNNNIVSMDNTGISIKTGGLYLLNTNNELVGNFNEDSGNTRLETDMIIASDIQCPTIIKKYSKQQTVFYVNGTNGNDLNDGTSTNPKKTIGSIIASLDKYLDKDIFIYVYGTCDEIVYVAGFIGNGSITISFQGNSTTNTILNGGIHVYNNMIRVHISGTGRSYNTIQATSTLFPVYATHTTYLYLGNVKLDARGLAESALSVFNARVYGGWFSVVGGTKQCMAIKGLSTAYFTDVWGVGDINIEGSSSLTFKTKRPQGSIVNEGGWYQEQGTVTQTSDTGATTPTTKTETIYAIDTWSYNHKYKNWKSDNRRPYHGQWESYGLTQGFILYNASDVDKFKNKTISKVTLFIRRYNGGGYSSALDNGLTLRYHNLNSLGGNEPPTNFISITNIYRPAWGASATIDITNDTIKNALKAGSSTFRGFSFYTTDTLSTNYCILEDYNACNYALTVTYSG
ncbi:phage tail spike protein [Caloramator sp. ALD01]|uniref:phage tail spike protein n=1 Tax=Caloramator sp. ALD01 TaxID=1031288 RepID=UPI0004107095|nr:phage tail spike protein [Caloramator sp. ALD01]